MIFGRHGRQLIVSLSLFYSFVIRIPRICTHASMYVLLLFFILRITFVTFDITLYR